MMMMMIIIKNNKWRYYGSVMSNPKTYPRLGRQTIWQYNCKEERVKKREKPRDELISLDQCEQLHLTKKLTLKKPCLLILVFY